MNASNHNPETIKQRLRDRAPVRVTWTDLGWDADQLRQKCAEDGSDLLFVDTQHQPFDEYALVRYCRDAEAIGCGALPRIRHPDDAHLIGRYLDFGALGVVVPKVDSTEIAHRAIEAFYYPPLGKRCWGPNHAFRFASRKWGFEYAEWWNRTGVLVIQIESLEAVRIAATLAIPGIDIITFGGKDLTLSIRTATDPEWNTIAACREAVIERTRHTGIRVGKSDTPLGDL